MEKLHLQMCNKKILYNFFGDYDKIEYSHRLMIENKMHNPSIILSIKDDKNGGVFLRNYYSVGKTIFCFSSDVDYFQNKTFLKKEKGDFIFYELDYES